jgi:hypothetical protein
VVIPSQRIFKDRYATERAHKSAHKNFLSGRLSTSTGEFRTLKVGAKARLHHQNAAVASIQKTENGRYRARYRDSSGKEHLKRFALKRDAQRWLDTETTKLQTGTWVSPRTAKTTLGQWCDVWLRNYATRKRSTVRQAQVHVDRIKEQFGTRRLDSIRPSEVRAWLVSLKEDGYAPSYIYALHERMRQIYSDAVHDGLVARSPLSRRTSPVRVGSTICGLYGPDMGVARCYGRALPCRATAGRIRRSEAR